MHIPDGILSPTILAAGAVVSVAVLAKSVQESKNNLEQTAVPIMGVMAAFIFAAQMVNFPLLGAAASGHLIGGALAAYLFGFWPTTLIMTTVVTIQAIVFQDGGISVLGVNILNMAILAPLAATLVYKLLGKSKIPVSALVFIAGWVSVVVTSIVAALQLGASDVVSYQLALKTLILWHAIIGIGEGLITAAVVPFARRSSFFLRRGEEHSS
ncbi:cobalamin (vitamin B12) biosynthesis protein CbiM [Neobacillus bataviensis LMG 21833]|uniref:Cobalamin (Vitamin B12) biosynthesis protein CbiM n=1 Tax=Neobacillus bataviensis LMG 21833 TaxID=1117379 RepID=K6DFR1_9BACI|nr:energy-coupling factor ABC transporter permease [Neobacillus bataviensis]EKN71397.1 cobalamin (vitamin B12) biosynthesis protein CbiM [Neobacillus bataviensis LMG 21833]